MDESEPDKPRDGRGVVAVGGAPAGAGRRQIRIRGARTNNLQAVDVDIPRNELVVIVGVSGSGKSSLVFDTIAAEAGFQVNETFPPFVRNRLPRWSRPDVDSIEGLSPVVVIDQRRIGGNARSTVGTITDTWSYLRLLYSRIGQPHVGESNHFSFNDPAGMCPTCSGIGRVVTSAVDRFVDIDRSLADGAIQLPGFGEGNYWYRQYADIGTFDVDTPLREWTTDERQALLYGGDAAARLGSKPPSDYEGIVERFERIYLRTAHNLSDRKQDVIRRFTREEGCPDCGGDRLNATSRRVTVAGLTIAEMSRLEIVELAEVVGSIEAPTVAPVVDALRFRLDAIAAIGLGYLTLARATTSLSGGESQRIKTVKHLGSSLTEMVYVFDEPTVGQQLRRRVPRLHRHRRGAHRPRLHGQPPPAFTSTTSTRCSTSSTSSSAIPTPSCAARRPLGAPSATVSRYRYRARVSLLLDERPAADGATRRRARTPIRTADGRRCQGVVALFWRALLA